MSPGRDPRAEPESGIPAPGTNGQVRIKVPPPPAAPKHLQLEADIEGKKVERWKVIAGIVSVVGALLTSCAGGVVGIVRSMQPPPVSATSAEVLELQRKLASAEDALRSSEIGPRLDRIDERLDLWQRQREADLVLDRKQDERIEFLAEFAYRLNGAAPVDGYPAPREGVWKLPAARTPSAVTQHRTDRRWPE